MKRLIFLIAFNIYLQGVFSQIDTRFFQKGDALRESPLLKSIHSGKIIMKTLPRFDVEALLKEDRELNGMDIPYRFGKGFDVSYTLDDGEWHDVEDGRIWTMTFAAEGAYSLNFVFSDFHLPKHAKLFIVDKDETVLYGPVTESVIPENAILLSDVIPGSEVTVFLYEPKESAGTSSLCIKRVVHGYRSVESQTAYGAFGASSPCNIDVACKPEWKQESNAVGLVLLANATEWCSGSVLLSTNFAYKPYFLTAFHCIDYSPNDGVLSSTEIEEAENWLFKFNYKKVACGSNALASSKTYSGATLKAAWNKTDFALLKIDSDVSTNDSLAWLGWDRSAGSFYQGAGIHHPCGDVMKVSIEDNLITTIDWNYSQEFNHWLVNWDEGIYEGGSSGSPLLNSSHRVIGQLHGGPSPYDICDRTIAKYGRLDLSWAGNGTSGFRLSDWLDPINAGDITTNGFMTYISGNSIVCTQNHYILTQVSHQSTISWGLENVLPAGGMAIQSQYNNEVYVQRVGTQHTEADLVATITRGGNVIAKRKMHLISPGPFNAIVYQHEGQYQGILYPAMNTNVSNASSIVEVNPNCDITLSSLNLKQMEVSYSGAIPTYWSGVMYIPNNDLVYEDSLASLTSGNIYFQLPYTGSTYDFHIYGQDAENCNSFDITLRVRPYPINLTQNTALLISHTGTSLEVMLPETVYSESGTSHSEQFWKLQIYNTQTGLLVYEHIENSSTGQLPTTLLSKGIYTIVAKTNTSAYSTTFTIK